RDLPEETLAQRLLRHAPRIERPQRSNNIWNTALLTNMRRRHGRMIEDCMNMGEAKALNVRTEPRREGPRVFERLSQLRLKEDRRHTFVIQNLALRHLRLQSR